ncbi:CHC2 zinc finger domain-containing protein [Oleispirillum naphthae]|uniref:CHC2 zinc finger domain-containing protein n=1 Tax=Oleispirillum naphthae TaxID=2838853 RepID=UPI0030822148
MNGGFSDRFIDDVRARTSLVALIGAKVKLSGRNGEFSGLCPFHSERTPSFTVSERKGFYHCFGCGAHGDAFDWVMDRHGVTFPEAVEELAIKAGLQPDREGRMLPEAKPIARPSEAEAAAEDAEKLAKAAAIWRDALPIAGSLAERYLEARGIDLPRVPGWPVPTLRFVPALPCWQYDKAADRSWYAGAFPAMVGYVQGPNREFVGVHRTFLTPDGSGKAVVPKPKKMLGNVFGGYLRLCPASAKMLNAEGIETTLSAIGATGRPGWAALSEGNLGAAMPTIVRDLTICRDNDTKDEATTIKRVDSAIAAHSARGVIVRVACPPRGMDFNDLLRRV